ncbi:MAG: phosphoribosylformylglycinamidine cyclo-ligase [Gammaproteobacteria bacterium]|jgi:phosphoribosylformylglycinamidine cyclo-ligase|nr:phosphoribosylformylglycinamidine cyclo-ligase [Gammaproteobacteria bacterium]MDP7418473.1 phosphoribosylformylglycinamidine cyclo-ligase [Gammaproteobacteria bacterium]MDP7659920.1 phosphoribosylformylglycinamidine cyclo-ligase [Gammaproteobacteria bacterium]HJP38856.1 phosphoribosylformylglycinamidine cyclo-ligase [Gammaproteobacteria bacterium]
MTDNKHLTYKDAGVDIDAGNALVERIKPLVNTTLRQGVLGGIGGFGGLFELDLEKHPRPVLVSGTDGVGTKLKLAIELNRYDTIGIDLVAMCANDIIVLGAEPLFFLDYYATGELDVEIGAAIVAGIADGCRQSGAALLGGETAELPGLYATDDFDLAGFCVGVVDREQIIDCSRLQADDTLLGLAASGPHSNGYSLIRRVLDLHPDGVTSVCDGKPVGQLLLEPTRIYVKAILTLMKVCPISAIAHITGGGLPENVARILPDNLDARIDSGNWARPAIFSWLQEQGQIEEAELLRTFNCGVGMVIAVRPEHVATASQALEAAGETVMRIGSVTAGSGQVLID